MAKTEISLNASSALPAVSMKRKRGEIADSEWMMRKQHLIMNSAGLETTMH